MITRTCPAGRFATHLRARHAWPQVTSHRGQHSPRQNQDCSAGACSRPRQLMEIVTVVLLIRCRLTVAALACPLGQPAGVYSTPPALGLMDVRMHHGMASVQSSKTRLPSCQTFQCVTIYLHIPIVYFHLPWPAALQCSTTRGLFSSPV